MNPLPRIPTPPAQRWRQFRSQSMPGFVFAVICLAVALLWRQVVIPASVVGEVEAVTSIVTSVQAGSLASLAVDRFTEVTKGQELGQVVIARPEVMKATLAAIQADLESAGVRIESSEWNRVQTFEEMQLALLDAKVLIAIAQPGLVEAELQFKRDQELARSDKSVISQAQLDLSRAKRDRLQAEVTQRTTIISAYDKALAKLQTAQIGSASTGVARQIAADQARFTAEQKPIALIAPIDGIVTRILKHSGDTIAAGEEILTITAPHPTRIIGYVVSPAQIVPHVGDGVEVRTRTARRLMGRAEVLQVGGQYELFDTSLISPNMVLKARALSFHVSLPPNLKLLPGEVVDLALRPAR